MVHFNEFLVVCVGGVITYVIWDQRTHASRCGQSAIRYSSLLGQKNKVRNESVLSGLHVEQKLQEFVPSAMRKRESVRRETEGQRQTDRQTKTQRETDKRRHT